MLARPPRVESRGMTLPFASRYMLAEAGALAVIDENDG